MLTSRRIIKAGCRALLLLAAPLSVAAQPGDVAASGCAPTDAVANQLPDYPPDQLWRLLSYTITVVIEADACGRTTRAELEQASGVAALDQAALRSAERWTVPVNLRGRPRYRLPFAFHPMPAEVQMRSSERIRDPFFEERQRATVTLASAKSVEQRQVLPGFIADPYPIGFMAVPEAMQVVMRGGVVARYSDELNVWLWDEEGLSLFQWDGVLLIRNRRVVDGDQQFVVSSVLCSPDLDACRQRLGQLRAARGVQVPTPVALP